MRISIHAPRVGSDFISIRRLSFSISFQSTLPVWGATCVFVGSFIGTKFQSTLPVWGATRDIISPPFLDNLFQSTLPVWGATGFSTARFRLVLDFNPRSPCGERLSTLPLKYSTTDYFNPRSPCGERRCVPKLCQSVTTDFNPRSPCGERLETHIRRSDKADISIHAPRVGSD